MVLSIQNPTHQLFSSLIPIDREVFAGGRHLRVRSTGDDSKDGYARYKGERSEGSFASVNHATNKRCYIGIYDENRSRLPRYHIMLISR